VSITAPKKGEEVPSNVKCIFCDREAREGELYGTDPESWDFIGVCPECWDSQMGEE
jgi:hypothetical protein